MAEGPLTCDVIITSDGQCVRDVPRRFVRERPPERQLERQPAAAPAAAAPAGAVPAGAVETAVGAAARAELERVAEVQAWVADVRAWGSDAKSSAPDRTSDHVRSTLRRK